MKKIQQALSKKPGKDAAARAQQAEAVEQQPLLSPEIRPQPYRHISMGSGGVISQKPPNNLSESKTFVGTTGTLDTVGVFFEISDTQSFAAHIEAYTTKRLSSSSSSTEKRSYCLNFQSASKLRSQVIARLDKVVPEPPSDRMRGTLVMTCSRLSGEEARASEVIAKAVREWLGAGLSSGGRVAVAGVGFVGWPAGGRVIFETAVGEEWKAVECRIGEGEWRFGVVEREVQGSEEAW